MHKNPKLEPFKRLLIRNIRRLLENINDDITDAECDDSIHTAHMHLDDAAVALLESMGLMAYEDMEGTSNEV